MNFLFYLVTGFLIMLVGRIWHQNHIETLSAEYREKLFQLFGKRNNLNTYSSIAILIIFVVIVLFDFINLQFVLIGFVLINLLSLAIPLNLNYNKMVANDFPVSFLNNYFYTSILRIIGTIFIFSYLFFEV